MTTNQTMNIDSNSSDYEEILDTQYCRKCENLKRSSEFYSKEKWQCKQCNAKYCRQWKKDNREKYNEYHRNYRANNTSNQIKQALRSRMSKLIHGKQSHTLLLYLGCDFDFFESWIQSQFTPEMTLDNFGIYWHIDHVLPVKMFNHEDEDAIKFCWNWTNLRPLEASENISKSAKIDFDLYNQQVCLAYNFIDLYNRISYSNGNSNLKSNLAE